MVHAYAIDPERADAATPGLLEAIEVTRTAPAPGASWEDAILADELDMLIYPEIGMARSSGNAKCASIARSKSSSCSRNAL